MNEEKLKSFIQSFLDARKTGEIESEISHHDLMESYRDWQRKNILDCEKLKNYSDAEFAEIFGEMFDYSDGDASSHALNRGMHFKSTESRIAVRPAFINMVNHIVNSKEERFDLLEELLGPNSRYKVPGIGLHMATTLINALYPDVPPINRTTKEFFANIGEQLPTKISDAQHEVSQFFERVVELSNNELNYDDANHMLWYSSNTDSGRRFMEENFAVTFENKLVTRKKPTKSNKKPQTHEERVAEYAARLQAIHDQSLTGE